MPSNRYQYNFGIIKESEQLFDYYKKKNIISFSFTKKGIIGLTRDGFWFFWKVTKKLDNVLRGRQRTLPSPQLVAHDNGNRYYIQFTAGKPRWNSDRAFSRVIEQAFAEGKQPIDVAFGPKKKGWCIIWPDGSFDKKDLPNDLYLTLKKLKKTGILIKAISISPHGHWFIVCQNGDYEYHLPTRCKNGIDELKSKYSTVRIKHVWLGVEDAFCIAYEGFNNIHPVAIGNMIRNTPTWNPLTMSNPFGIKLLPA